MILIGNIRDTPTLGFPLEGLNATALHEGTRNLVVDLAVRGRGVQFNHGDRILVRTVGYARAVRRPRKVFLHIPACYEGTGNPDIAITNGWRSGVQFEHGDLILIGAVGIYGVVSYVVSQRTHEIGVRMALGARAAKIGCMVMRRSLAVTLAGVFAGVTGAVALTSFMSSLLYGVSPLDPVTFGVVITTLIVVATVAACVPARRATRVDPLEALRWE